VVGVQDKAPEAAIEPGREVREVRAVEREDLSIRGPGDISGGEIAEGEAIHRLALEEVGVARLGFKRLDRRREFVVILVLELVLILMGITR